MTPGDSLGAHRTTTLSAAASASARVGGAGGLAASRRSAGSKPGMVGQQLAEGPLALEAGELLGRLEPLAPVALGLGQGLKIGTAVGAAQGRRLDVTPAGGARAVQVGTAPPAGAAMPVGGLDGPAGGAQHVVDRRTGLDRAPELGGGGDDRGPGGRGAQTEADGPAHEVLEVGGADAVLHEEDGLDVGGQLVAGLAHQGGLVPGPPGSVGVLVGQGEELVGDGAQPVVTALAVAGGERLAPGDDGLVGGGGVDAEHVEQRAGGARRRFTRPGDQLVVGGQRGPQVGALPFGQRFDGVVHHGHGGEARLELGPGDAVARRQGPQPFEPGPGHARGVGLDEPGHHAVQPVVAGPLVLVVGRLRRRPGGRTPLGVAHHPGQGVALVEEPGDERPVTGAVLLAPPAGDDLGDAGLDDRLVILVGRQVEHDEGVERRRRAVEQRPQHRLAVGVAVEGAAHAAPRIVPSCGSAAGRAARSPAARITACA